MNNKNLQRWRQEYEQLHLSETSRKRLLQKVHPSAKDIFTRIACAAAVCVLLFTSLTFGALNLSPTLAQNLSAHPSFATLVNIFTFNRYNTSDGNMELHMQTPHVSGLDNPTLEEKLNEEFDTLAAGVIAAFEQDLQALRTEAPELDPHISVLFDYQVLTNTPNYLSLDIYQLTTAGSAGTSHHYYTVDKRTGQLLTLSSLFGDDVDFITPISEYIRQQIAQRLEEEPGAYWDGQNGIPGFSSIQSDQAFYINTSGNVVICFEQYEIGPGSTGSPAFVIPSSVVAPLQ